MLKGTETDGERETDRQTEAEGGGSRQTDKTGREK